VAADSIDYYRLLGVHAGASQRAIRSAYRRLARQYHPDMAKGEDAARQFLLIREAYEVLSDPKKREQFNRVISRRAPSSRPPRAATRSSRSGSARPILSEAPPRAFRFVIAALGVRIDTGVSLGGLWVPRRSPRRRS